MEKKVKVLAFFANWCRGCDAMRNDFYAEARRTGISYDVIDVDSEEGALQSIKYEVKNVPTLVFIKKGKVIGRSKGNQSYLDIERFAKK